TVAPVSFHGALISFKTFAFRTPMIVRNTFSASLLIAAGILCSFVAIASCTLTSPLSMLTDLTKPNETMSRVKPGYLTDLSASRTCSSETDIVTQIYARLERSKTGQEFHIMWA